MQNLSCDPLTGDLEEEVTLEAFVKICLFVINITRVTIIDMANLQDGNSFQDAGPMIVLRRARLISGT
jgi:hypothetical protein